MKSKKEEAKAYEAYVKGFTPHPRYFSNGLKAFVTGGLICVLGQLIQNGWVAAGLDTQDAGTATSCSLVLLSALL